MKCNVGDNGNISIFTGVHPNPLVEDVLQGSEMLRKHNCDSVIAIGGMLCNNNIIFSCVASYLNNATRNFFCISIQYI